MPRRTVIVFTTLVSALALAGPARAAAPGLNVSDYGDAQTALDQGARQVRFFVRWSDFEPSSAAGFDAITGPAAPNAFTTGLEQNVSRVLAAGVTPIMVVSGVPAWAASGIRPRSPSEYAAFVGELAQWLAGKRKAGEPSPVFEIWNEPDTPEFWGEPPNPDFYTAMLRASFAAIKAGDPGATVLVGPTTGNNYAWIESIYARGGKGSFDGVSVHTDTACSVVGPDAFYRDPNGRLGQFTFLGYREIRTTMLANGDDKPIWMTELGWSSTNGGPTSCASGQFAGQKPSGISEADQSTFLTRAFQCLANDRYVVAATWFTLRDDLSNPVRENHLGLFRSDGSAKPAQQAFRSAAAQGPAPCGDFEPPALTVTSPTEGQRFDNKLDISAAATDAGVGLGRITFAYDGGQEIRNFTDALVNGGTVGLTPWQNSGRLALGAHTIEITALDKNGNRVTKVTNVTKVTPGSSVLPQLGKTVVAELISGKVFVRLPVTSRARAQSRAAQAPRGFTPLKGVQVLPVGTLVQATRGRLALTSAASVTQTQRSEFYAGLFQIRQKVAERPVTDLLLRSPNFRKVCGSRARGAVAFAAKRRTRKVVSRLFGNGKGSFRTTGRQSAATVRGTIWLTEERCEGTLTRVTRGVVSVRDFARKKTVTVRAGDSYLARATRASIQTQPRP